MKHTLILTFTLDDLGSDSFLGYALDQVLGALGGMPLDKDVGEGFIRADLDGDLLVDNEGNSPDDVRRVSQYRCLLKELKKRSNTMKKVFPENTVYVVVLLVSEAGKKKLMIARIPEDEEYEKNRNNFLTVVMGRCRVERCEIEDVQSIRSEEELEAYKRHVKEG